MYILATDTSTDYASVALLEKNRILFELNESGKHAHNKRLFDMISELVGQCGISIRDIDLFAIGAGPGSFTGLRVGVSAIKGIAIGLNKKIIPVSSIDAVALNAFSDFPDEKEINVILEGRQKDFFHAKYTPEGKDVKKISEIIVRPYEDYSYINGVTVGNVPVELIGSEYYSGGYNPKAGCIGRLAYSRKDEGGYDYNFEPEYYKEFKIR